MNDGAKIAIGAILLLIIIAAFMYVLPVYGVWQKELSGKAQLKEAEWNRQITIKEAEAERQAAELKKETDIIRAEGIAEANRIISKSLTSEYITWKWVEGLHDGSSEVIYVPTEANLPLLEARDVRS
ncbi:hypothetical protein K8R47_01980 [archaeon]|nr:hypothetical protein [archaeon]